MLKQRNLSKTHFIPMKHMRTVVEHIESDFNKYNKREKFCNNNLYLLQNVRLNTLVTSSYSKVNWWAMFSLACHKAFYAHDWDKLLYILKKYPLWKFFDSQIHKLLIIESSYTRYLIMLLMYHPSSQAQGLLCEYLHMVWGCRSDQDKKAILKVILHMPKKLPGPRNK